MTKRKYTKLTVLGLSIAYILLFAAFYVTDYLTSVMIVEIGDALYYIIHALTSILEYCLPLLSAVTVLVISLEKLGRAAVSSLLLALPRFFYLLPYYYLYEIAYGNDSFESLGLSMLISAGLIALLWGHIFLLYSVMRYFILRGISRSLGEELPPMRKRAEGERKELLLRAKDNFGEALGVRSVLDLSVPVISGIFAAAFLDFLFALIVECINAASYLIEYAGSYTPEEIGLMTASFLFILLRLILAHIFAVLIKKLATSVTVD